MTEKKIGADRCFFLWFVRSHHHLLFTDLSVREISFERMEVRYFTLHDRPWVVKAISFALLVLGAIFFPTVWGNEQIVALGAVLIILMTLRFDLLLFVAREVGCGWNEKFSLPFQSYGSSTSTPFRQRPYLLLSKGACCAPCLSLFFNDWMFFWLDAFVVTFFRGFPSMVLTQTLGLLFLNPMAGGRQSSPSFSLFMSSSSWDRDGWE